MCRLVRRGGYGLRAAAFSSRSSSTWLVGALRIRPVVRHGDSITRRVSAAGGVPPRRQEHGAPRPEHLPSLFPLPSQQQQSRAGRRGAPGCRPASAAAAATPPAAAKATLSAHPQATAALLLSASPDDGNTLLHCLCLGEGLGLGGSLLLALAGRSGAPVWPARHQRGRGQLLALLLVRQPRLALLAGCRNAAGDTPLHAAVRSQSWQVLALLLAALQQLVAVSQPELLPLLLGAQNADGLAPAELALALRQWPAVRLLAAAARGAPPPSRSQLEACSLVQHYLSGGRGGSLRGGGGEGQLSVGPLHVRIGALRRKASREGRLPCGQERDCSCAQGRVCLPR